MPTAAGRADTVWCSDVGDGPVPSSAADAAGGPARRHRPVLHYEPPAGWLNDPNGLVQLDGEWHLCYQHHPYSRDWGPMHWGHAVSTDLVRWHDLPVALAPDALGTVYSGCAVVDRSGSAGFGAGALVAVYTQCTPTAQVQSIAGSTDRGRTWQVHPANPVLRQPPGVVDFRDPKVSWFGDAGTGHWTMVVAAGDGVRHYASPDLATWEPTGAFAPERGLPHGVWETPDLFGLPVAASNGRRWVLTAGALERGPAGGSGTRYWVGDFDGAAFTADGPARWVDHGADFYAAQSWSDVADGRRVWVAWMSNWSYAADIPAGAARGQMTLPRQVWLTSDGVLAQRPVAEIDGHLGEAVDLGAAGEPLPTGAARIRVRCRASDRGRTVVHLSAAGAHVRVIHDAAAGTVSLDRTGAAGIGHGFGATHTAPVTGRGPVDLDVVVDRSSVEVFAAGGRVCLTDLVLGFAGDAPVRAAVDGDLVVAAELRHAGPRHAG